MIRSCTCFPHVSKMTHLTRVVHILNVYEKKAKNSDGQQLHQYQQNDHLSAKPLNIKKRLPHMSLEIQILALGRHNNVAVSNPLPLDNCAYICFIIET